MNFNKEMKGSLCNQKHAFDLAPILTMDTNDT